MSIYSKKLDFISKIIVWSMFIIEKTILKKRIFKIVINLLNRIPLYYFTRYIDPKYIELIS